MPSGNLTWLWKISVLTGKIHYKWPFSIAILNYQRVYPIVILLLIPLIIPLLTTMNHYLTTRVHVAFVNYQRVYVDFVVFHEPEYFGHLVMISLEKPIYF